MAPGGTYQRPTPMLPVTRPVGQNDVGVLAWQLTLRTPECPQGRKARAHDSCASHTCDAPQPPCRRRQP